MKIIVAPLDWGLGHTTRCIPLIQALLKKNVEVLLAGNEVQRQVLMTEFPHCSFLALPGYNIHYSSRPGGFMLKLLQQLPRVAAAIKREHRWLQQVVVEKGIDGVISDNRFGLYNPNIPCVFITHQLQVKTGMGQLSDQMARAVNYRRIQRYARCWIPDFEGIDNLAGSLSHPEVGPRIPTHYIGPLSRMSKVEVPATGKILVVLSGPEPQRSLFEQKILEQAKDYTGGRITIVRGLPLGADLPVDFPITIFNHLPKQELGRMMQEADLVICRSGYSSVMDINAIEAKSVLVPTPGQTEQEYLGQYLMHQQFALGCRQDAFHLSALVEKADAFNYSGFIKPDTTLLSQAIEIFLDDCRSNRSKGALDD